MSKEDLCVIWAVSPGSANQAATWKPMETVPKGAAEATEQWWSKWYVHTRVLPLGTRPTEYAEGAVK